MIDQLLKATQEEDWFKASTLLYNHWRLTCPRAYPSNVDQPWENQVDDKIISKDLLYPLAAMFCCEENCTESEKKNVSLKKLSELTGIDTTNRRPGQICGRVFKNGEPNYTCKECATDGTCVLCRECFINSAHTKHKYKMHTSMGCGYCDCGDPEAWSRDFACSLHSCCLTEEEQKNTPLGSLSLPLQLERRAYNLTVIACRFIVKFLCWSEEAWSGREIIWEEEQFQTILFNDETHTYDAVIRALEIAVHCTNNQAMRLATIVDREGRSIVKTGTYEICENVKATIERRTARDSNRRTQKSGPLEVKVMKSSLVSYQQFAVRLLNWLSLQAQEFSPMSLILGDVLLFECSDDSCTTNFVSTEVRSLMSSPPADSTSPPCNHASNCLKMMLSDRKLWKAARSGFHQALMCSVLMNLRQKQEFGRIFVKNYVALFNDFIEDDHEHSVSIVSMAVQVFTVPTVARQLIKDENVLHLVLSALKDFCQKYITVSPSNEKLFQLDFSSDSHPAVLKRAMYMLQDVSYLLNIIPKPEDWNEELRVKFGMGVFAFLRFLRDVEGMDEVKRQNVEHQLMESEWETAFNIFIRSQECLSLMLAWSKTDTLVHLMVFRKCLEEIKTKVQYMPEFSTQTTVEINGFSAKCIEFDVSKNSLSVHHPLWRFIAGLFTAPHEILCKYVVDESGQVGDALQVRQSLAEVAESPVFKLNLLNYLLVLMDMPLRVMVLQAQCNAQLWRRNGFSLVNQVHNYSSHLCRTEMYDRDILMLQVIASLMKPNEFIVRVFDRFGLSKWAEVGFEDTSALSSSSSRQQPTKQSSQEAVTVPPTPATPEESSKISVLLAEEMLQLFIVILGERYLPGISDCTQVKALEREIIHLLCSGPKPFSQIERIVPNEPTMQRLSLDAAVRSVGEFRKSTATSSGMFYLKENFLTEYNPFFYHYTKSLISQAEQQQKKERANLPRELMACPPPIPPPFSPFFKPVIKLAESDLFVKLLRVVFERVAKRSRFTSDGCFHRALFLTAMALNEQQQAINEGREFNFIKKAEQEDLLNLMIRLQGRPEVETHANLLWLTIQRYNILSSSLSRNKGEVVEIELEPKLDEKSTKCRNVAKAQVAARKRQLAMERMKQLQKSFKKMCVNTDDPDNFPETSSADDKIMSLCAADDCEQGTIPKNAGFPVCCGPDRTVVLSKTMRRLTCILCQEDEILSYTSQALVCSGYIQNSRIFANKNSAQPQDTTYFEELYSSAKDSGIFSPICMDEGIQISTCSHIMHSKCYTAFIDSLNARERSRPRQQSINSRMINHEAGEFLCPLCKRLSNCALPFLPVTEQQEEVAERTPESLKTFKNWLTYTAGIVVEPLEGDGASEPEQDRKRSCSDRSFGEEIKKAKSETEIIEPLTGVSLSAAFGAATLLDFADLEDPLHLAGTDGLTSTETSFFYDALMSEATRASIEKKTLLQHRFFHSLSQLQNGMSRVDFETVGTNKFIGLSIPSFFDASCFSSISPFLKRLCEEKDKVNLLVEDKKLVERFVETMDVLKACTFLLRSVCAVLQEEGKPLFGALNARQRDCINALSRLAAVIPMNCHPIGIRILVSFLLNPLLAAYSCSQTTKGLPLKCRNYASSQIHLMDLDILTLAVSLVTCINCAWVDGELLLHNRLSAKDNHQLAHGSLNEQYAIRLMLLAQLFQIFMLFNEDLPVNSAQAVAAKGENSDTMVLTNRLQHLYSCTHPNGKGLENVQKLKQKLCDAAVKFLGPLAHLYHAITLIPEPESLRDPSIPNFASLCRYLGLPQNLLGILEGVEVDKLFQMWPENIPPKKLRHLVNSIQLPLKMNLLIDLPNDYSELINSAAQFRCPSIQAEDPTSAVPTLCLNCGMMLCSQSYCCQKMLNGSNVGACTYHMAKCNGSSGVFLRIRDCQVLFLTSYKRGCHKPAPYVDEFGETDPGFRRGNPMYLNTELYSKIQRVWLHQEVPEEIVYSYDLNHRNIVFEWQHF